VTTSRIAWRFAQLGLAVVAWLVCFAILVRFGTWAVFVFASVALLALAWRFDPALPALLRPSLTKVGVGFFVGAIMVLLTQAGFAVFSARWPGISDATLGLYTILNSGGFSPSVKAGFVVVIAASEEILFRGGVADTGERGDQGKRIKRLTRGDLGRIVLLAVCYAAATLTLGSLLLMICALLCGIAWGSLRIVTRSLVPPMVAHVVWDLGIFLVWPLV
jgi:membrane protease YdiL (CAAX protease family)